MIVTKEHFRYLYIQRGEVSDAYKQGFDHWKRAYEASLDAIVASMDPVLPENCQSVLDVGGGLGGIGVVLSRRYPSVAYRVLDGLDGPPEVLSHTKPFSNAKVASDFLTANEVKDFGFYDPSNPVIDRKFDLVVSFAAWCFHILPSDYLDLVKSSLAPKATVIVDVRKSRRDWVEELVRAFGRPTVLDQGKKHARLAWHSP